MDINIIVAVGKNGAIGKKGDLIWHIGEDLRHFKAVTTGYPVIMGRKTWESLPKRPLPGRLNIVITGNADYKAEGAVVVDSVEKAVEAAGTGKAFVIGGAKVYEAFMPLADHLYLTVIDAEDPDADTFIDIDSRQWQLIEESEEKKTPEGIPYKFMTFRRI